MGSTQRSRQGSSRQNRLGKGKGKRQKALAVMAPGYKCASSSGIHCALRQLECSSARPSAAAVLLVSLCSENFALYGVLHAEILNNPKLTHTFDLQTHCLSSWTPTSGT